MATPANESVLHYIWKELLFDIQNIQSENGELIEIQDPGIHNFESGPDFREGKIKINQISWNGSIEIHVRSSEWYSHKHHVDPAYQLVILHVVWENDEQVCRPDGRIIPTIVLKERIDPKILIRHRDITSNPYLVPCGKKIAGVAPLVRLNAIEGACIERLETRFSALNKLYDLTIQNWDELSWLWLARSFGFMKNNECFESLAKSIPYKVLLKERDLIIIEALLFGQAGFLDTNSHDVYHKRLREIYQFIQRKYQLEKAEANSQWKFMRMRPGNFPTLRIAQLAAVLHRHPRLFQNILSISSFKEVQNLIKISTSEYWETHFHFGKTTKLKNAMMGTTSIRLLILNSIVPLQYFYAAQTDQEVYAERAISLLDSQPPEDNKKIRHWKKIGVVPKSALDSQGLIHLLDNYCLKKKCLNCNIGRNILRN